jgi:hypothetical protein
MKEVPIEGWLVCNGAEVSRQRFPELSAIRLVSDTGGVNLTLPNFPVEYRNGVPIKGWAICPATQGAALAGEVATFSVEDNI